MSSSTYNTKLAAEVQAWMERLGELRTREMAKSTPKVTASDAYFHPSEKSSPHKPAPAGPPEINTYRSVPAQYRKGEDSGSVISMISGDVHRMDKNMNVLESANSSCPGCKRSMSPIVAALRRGHGGKCLTCSGQSDTPHTDFASTHRAAELDVKHAQSAVAKMKAAMGKAEPEGSKPCSTCSGKGQHKSVIHSEDPGAHVKCWTCGGSGKKDTETHKGELKYHNNEPQYNEENNNWGIDPKEPNKNPGSGGKITKNPIGNSENDGASSVTFPMKKGDAGMSMPSAPKPPQAAGATPSKAGGTPKVSTPKPAAPAMSGTGMGKTEGSSVEESVGKPLMKPSASGAQHRAMAAAAGGNSTLGIPKKVGKDFVAADKGKKFGKNEAFGKLHKALEDAISRNKLTKTTPGTAAGDALQDAHEAKPTETGVPAAGKAQPKSPAEYDAENFRPASPGAAGAPIAKPKPTLKRGVPIASLRNIRRG